MNTQDRANILMVDDQPAKLLTYEVMLAELGENLLKASSGREALEILLHNDVAVVLLDVSMPDIDGFELASLIRQHPRFQRTAIIFISAVHLTDLDRLKGYQRGAVDYISVPVVPELLRARVSVFAELHRKTQQLESLNQELRRLSTRLMTTQDEERRRLAQDLHDGLGQDLAAVKMMLDGSLQKRPTEWKMNALAEAGEIVNRTIQQVRTMSHLLHPPLLDELGLVPALQWFVRGFIERSRIQVELRIEGDIGRLTPDIETALFRVAQESLTNIHRHSGSPSAVICVTRDRDTVVLQIADEGRGISQEWRSRNQVASPGVGIMGMGERLRQLGGRLEIESSGRGTTVTARVPIIKESYAAYSNR